MSRRLNFPRFLKESRLFIDIEVDYVYVAAIGFIMSTAIAFMLSIPIAISIFFIVFGTAVPVRAYQKLIKTAAPGWLKHKIYSLGLTKKKSKNGLPYGFDKIFED